jgi:hypothetical protein
VWRQAATLARVDGSARQSLAERFIHCTCVWGLWQVPNQGAVPIVGLTEMSLRRSGNRIAVVVNPSCKTRLNRQNQTTHQLAVTTRIEIE